MISGQKSTSLDIKDLPCSTDTKKSRLQYTVSDAINIIKCGVMALALAEYYEFKASNIISIAPGTLPRFFFDKEGFKKLCQKKLDNTLVLCEKTQSALIPILGEPLKQFHSLQIFKKFPFFFEIINENNYNNRAAPISNVALLERCRLMQMMWYQWNDAGLPHIISSLQALQRHISLKMKSPLAPDFELDIKNGLSVEYQAEIYANHLYGAKLLDAWHAYLISLEPKNRQPQFFLEWLKSLPTEKLMDFGIKSLDDIPTVQYFNDLNERSQWQLHISPEKIVTNDKLPTPKGLVKQLKLFTH